MQFRLFLHFAVNKLQFSGSRHFVVINVSPSTGKSGVGPGGLAAVAVETVEGEESKKAGPTRGRSWGGASGFGARATGGWTDGRTERRDGGK